MRKKKQFTPALFRRFVDEGRGTGVHRDFTALHQVSRRDPPSRGTSSIIPSHGRFSAGHLLSLAEQVAHEFGTMVANLDDRRHQVRLETGRHLNCLHDYSEQSDEKLYAGTVDICKALGIRHPILRKGLDVENWVFSTDLILTTKPPHLHRRMLAVSTKDVPFLRLPKRARDLLRVERAYWLDQGHEWMLLTPECYCPVAAEAVARYSGFAHRAEPIDDQHLERTAFIVKQHRHQSLRAHLYTLRTEFQCSMERAQDLFWQAVWKAHICVDWRTTLWSTDPIRIVSRSEFDSLNPVVSRRCAWQT